MDGVFNVLGTIGNVLARWTAGAINNDQAAAELETAFTLAIGELRGLRADIAADRREVDAEIGRLPRAAPPGASGAPTPPGGGGRG